MSLAAPSSLAGATRPLSAVLAGAAVGSLGGLIGLGGAEFRLPLLIGLFGFAALHAVILNKAMSLIVVATALPARLVALPADDVLHHWGVIVNLLGGTLVGAWAGASWAVRMRSSSLYRVIAVLLLLIAAAMLATHTGDLASLELDTGRRVVAGLAAGVIIGAVAALMGVAGGELLIPTIVLLFSLDVRVAGSLSLAVSLPTMLVAFARYSRDGSFSVLREHRVFVLLMAAGSVVGTLVGGFGVGYVTGAVLVPLLCTLLVASSWKVWSHSAQALPHRHQ